MAEKNINKQEFVKGFSKIATEFLESADKVLKDLEQPTTVMSTEAAKMFSDGMKEAFSTAEKTIKDNAELLSELCDKWASMPGYSQAVQDNFKDAGKFAKSVEDVTVSKPEYVIDENNDKVTEETVTDMKNVINKMLSVRYEFIIGLSKLAKEYQTADTEEVYTNIGKGVEALTNSLAVLTDKFTKSLGALGEIIGDISGQIANSSADFTTTSKSNASKIDDVLQTSKCNWAI